MSEKELIDRIINLEEAVAKLEREHKLMNKPVLTIGDVSDLSGYSKSSIYKKAESGVLPCHKRNGKVFFKREEVINYLTSK